MTKTCQDKRLRSLTLPSELPVTFWFSFCHYDIENDSHVGYKLVTPTPPPHPPPPDCKRKSNVTLNSLSLPFGSFRHHCTLFQRLRTSGQDASSSTKQVQFGRQSDSVGSVVQESKIISVKLPVGGKNSKSNWTRLNQTKRVQNK